MTERVAYIHRPPGCVFHFPIAPRRRKYMRFVILVRMYQFRALPFGVPSAPLIFTRVMGVIANYAHRYGVRVHLYLDDWLLRSLVRVTLLSDPHFRLYRSFVSRQRHGPVACCYSSACFSSGRPCRRCCGETNRLSDIPGLSGSPRSAAQACASLVLAHWDSRCPLLQCVPVGDSVRQALRWWASRAHVLFGQTLSQFRPQVTTYSDASLLGWGTLLDVVTGSGS